MPERTRPKPPSGQDYHLVGEETDDGDVLQSPVHPPQQPSSLPRRTIRTVLLAFTACIIVCLGLKLASDNGLPLGLPLPGHAVSGADCPCLPSDVPQYFQTSPQLWAGPTATGRAPFLAQTRTFEPTAYTPNGPLQTAIPVEGMTSEDRSIFQLMGSVASPRAFIRARKTLTGMVDTYPLTLPVPGLVCTNTPCRLEQRLFKSR